MAHIKKENKAEPMKDFVVYVIISPLDDKKFIVNKTGTNRLHKTYIEHYNFRVTKTKEMFAAARDKSLLPPIYRLEEIHTTEKEVFRHCVAWTKYFIDHGYEQIVDDYLGAYANEIVPETERYYEQIKSKSIEEVLNPSGGEFPNYGNLYKQRDSYTNLTIVLTKEEYLEIKKTAEEQEMTLSTYCKNMIMKGKILYADLSHISKLVDTFKDYKTMMRQMLFTINKTGKYYPADLKNIQNGVNKLIEIQNDVSEWSINFIRSLREKEN